MTTRKLTELEMLAVDLVLFAMRRVAPLDLETQMLMVDTLRDIVDESRRRQANPNASRQKARDYDKS